MPRWNTLIDSQPTQTDIEKKRLREVIAKFWKNIDEVNKLENGQRTAAFDELKRQQQRLAYLTGEVFYALRVFSRDYPQLNGYEIYGSSREVQENWRVYGFSISLSKRGKAITLRHHGEGNDTITFDLRVYNQITVEVENENLVTREVTFRVFDTAAEAEFWVEHHEQLDSQRR
jgi:hypothetical protein